MAAEPSSHRQGASCSVSKVFLLPRSSPACLGEAARHQGRSLMEDTASSVLLPLKPPPDFCLSLALMFTSNTKCWCFKGSHQPGQEQGLGRWGWGRMRLRNLLLPEEETLLFSQWHRCQPRQPSEGSAKGAGSAEGPWRCSPQRAQLPGDFGGQDGDGPFPQPGRPPKSGRAAGSHAKPRHSDSTAMAPTSPAAPEMPPAPSLRHIPATATTGPPWGHSSGPGHCPTEGLQDGADRTYRGCRRLSGQRRRLSPVEEQREIPCPCPCPCPVRVRVRRAALITLTLPNHPGAAEPRLPCANSGRSVCRK